MIRVRSCKQAIPSLSGSAPAEVSAQTVRTTADCQHRRIQPCGAATKNKDNFCEQIGILQAHQSQARIQHAIYRLVIDTTVQTNICAPKRN